MTLRTALLLACAATFGAVVTGCASNADEYRRAEGSRQVARPAPLDAPRAHLTRKCVRLGLAGATAYAAVVRHPVLVYQNAARPRVVGRFPRVDQNGYPVVFGVIGARSDQRCQARWLHVQLPTVPNGGTGWVRASDVRIYVARSRILVDLARRQLRAYRDGHLVLQAKVTIGAPQTPTPVGHFYVNERFVLESDSGPFGPVALGISAHSEVLRNWVQGGPIALHGTDQPQLLGRAASHGCIRLANADIERLFPLASAGTPVIIR